jgi:ribosome recycling factor
MLLEEYIKQGKEQMDSAISHLQEELKKIRAGKASPNMLAGLKVDYYGSPTPLTQVANVTATDSKTINIQPWEKAMLAPIEQCIFKANLGITPQNDGENVRLVIPPMTEERRKDLVKQCKGVGEDAKVSLRNIRQKLMDFVKKEVKDGYPEDSGKKKETEIQNMVNSFGDSVNKLIDAKEKDIMTV